MILTASNRLILATSINFWLRQHGYVVLSLFNNLVGENFSNEFLRLLKTGYFNSVIVAWENNQDKLRNIREIELLRVLFLHLQKMKFSGQIIFYSNNLPKSQQISFLYLWGVEHYTTSLDQITNCLKKQCDCAQIIPRLAKTV